MQFILFLMDSLSSKHPASEEANIKNIFNYAALPLSVASVVAGVFIILAATQVLPGGVNALSQLGGGGIALGSVVVGLGFIPLLAFKRESSAEETSKNNILSSTVKKDEVIDCRLVELEESSVIERSLKHAVESKSEDVEPDQLLFENPIVFYGGYAVNKDEASNLALFNNELRVVECDASGRWKISAGRSIDSFMDYWCMQDSDQFPLSSFLEHEFVVERINKEMFCSKLIQRLVSSTLYNVVDKRARFFDILSNVETLEAESVLEVCCRGRLSLTVDEFGQVVSKNRSVVNDKLFLEALNNGDENAITFLAQQKFDRSKKSEDLYKIVSGNKVDDISDEDMLDAYKCANMFHNTQMVNLLASRMPPSLDLVRNRDLDLFVPSLNSIQLRQNGKDFLLNLKEYDFLIEQNKFEDKHDREKYETWGCLNIFKGAMYAKKVVHELKLKHVEVANMYGVVKQGTSEVMLNVYDSGSVSSEQITCYREKIQKSKRKCSIEELRELMQLMVRVCRWGYIGYDFTVTYESIVVTVHPMSDWGLGRPFDLGRLQSFKEYAKEPEVMHNTLSAEYEQFFVENQKLEAERVDRQEFDGEAKKRGYDVKPPSFKCSF